MNIDLEILERIVSGNASEQESAQFEEWLSSKEEHRAIYERVKAYFNDNQLHDDIETKEVEARWGDFAQQHTAKFKERGNRRLTLVMRSIAAAAAVVLLTLLILPSTGDQNKQELAEKQPTKVIIKSQPLSQSDAVILTTAGGEEFKISEVPEVKSAILNSSNVDEKSITYENKPTVVEVEYHTLTTPKGKDYRVTLSDGTTVHLNANSQLIYPSSFAGEKERRVQLRGEAFFEVTHNKEHQFVVETEEVDVKVYGTKFNVNTNKVKVVETVLVEGSVCVQGKEGDEHQVKPSELAQYNHTTGLFEIREVEVMNYISWCSGTYSFFEETLENIMISLSGWYNVDIEFTDERIAQRKFVCNLPRYKTIEEIMDILCLSDNITYEITDNKVVISKK